VLIDCGFLPDDLSVRMEGTDASWETLDAVVLTHTHGDHLKKKCLVACAKHEIQFVCHAHHAEQLKGSRYFEKLRKLELVRTFDDGPFELHSSLRFHPIPLPHDCPPTFGFRIEARVPDESERWIKVGYLADLGVCGEQIAREVADVDLLALEFNHDEEMERRSGRHPRLIQRVLGPQGHLSNKQAAEVFRHVLEKGANGGLKVLLQMHLSRDCNRAELAYQAAQEVLLMTGAQTRVFSTRQDKRGTIHAI
jgi:phosphoribosyl 1,2-cyclic phosphodiesterase